MNFVKIQNKHDGPYDWTEYSFLFLGNSCKKLIPVENIPTDNWDVYSFSLDRNDTRKVRVCKNNNEWFELSGQSLSLFGCTVVWRFECTLLEFIKDVLSKITY